MQYPIDLSFKLISWGHQVAATDATGRLVFYVKQKAFRLKEAVTVYADREQTCERYKIAADRVIDFSARYSFTDAVGTPLGSVKRQGLVSLWRSRYDIFDGETRVAELHEENPWLKVLDGAFESIPFLGMFSGYVFHPSYVACALDGMPLLRLAKQPAFFEGKFQITKLADTSETDETRIVLSMLMMLLLERSKG